MAECHLWWSKKATCTSKARQTCSHIGLCNTCPNHSLFPVDFHPCFCFNFNYGLSIANWLRCVKLNFILQIEHPPLTKFFFHTVKSPYIGNQNKLLSPISYKLNSRGSNWKPNKSSDKNRKQMGWTCILICSIQPLMVAKKGMYICTIFKFSPKIFNCFKSIKSH